MATFKIRPETAKRAQDLIEHHDGDLLAAMYDIRIGLQGLGEYTDRKSEAVLDVLKWLLAQDEKFPETIQKRRDSLALIANEGQYY